MVWLRRLSIMFGSALLLLVIVPFLFLSWLIFTHSGAEWGARQALPYVPLNISYTELNGSFWSGLTLRQVAVEAQDESVGFESISATEIKFAWQPLALMTGRIQINQFEIKQMDVHLLTTPDAQVNADSSPIEFPVLDLPFNLEVKSLKSRGLRIITGSAPEVIPDLDAKFWLGGDQLILVQLKLAHDQVQYEFSGRARFAEIMSFSVKAPSHGINTTGECRGGVALSCQAELAWKNFSHPITDDMHTPNGNLALTLVGEKLAVKGSGDFIWPYEYAPIDTQVEIDGEVEFDSATAKIHSLVGRFAGGAVKAKGTLSWQHDFSLNLDLEGEHVSLAHWLPAEMQESQTSLRANLALAVPPSGVNMILNVPEMNVNFGAKPLRGGFTLSLNERGLDINRLAFSAPGSQISGDVSLGVNDEIDLVASIISTELQNLIPEISGQANIHVDAKGKIYAPTLVLSADTKNLVFQGLSAKSIALNVNLDVDQKLQSKNALNSASEVVDILNALRIKQLDGRVADFTADNTPLGSASITFGGTLAQHTIKLTGDELLGQFQLSELVFGGAVKLVGGDDVDAIIAASTWQGELKRLALKDPWHGSAWTLKAPSAGRVSADKLTWAPMCFSQSSLSLCLDKLTLTAWRSLTLSGDASGFYLDRERSLYPDWYEQLPLEWVLSGELMGRWHVVADFGAAAIDKLALSAQVESVSAQMIYTESDEPSLILPIEKFQVALTGDEKRLTLNGDIIFDENQSLALTGEAQQWQTNDRALTFNVKGGLGQLAYLQPFLTGQRDLVGVANADISVTVPKGSNQVEYQGRVIVSNAGVTLPASGTQLTDWQIVLEAERGDLVLNANGKVGDGLARVEGKVRSEKLNDTKLFQAELGISGKNIYLVNLPDVQLIADPSLKLTGEGLRWHLTGDVRVHDSSMVLRELPVSASGVSEDAKVYGREEPESKVGMLEFTSDVVLGFDKNVAFEGFGLTTDVGGELRFTRDQMRLNQVHGIVLLTNGRFRSYGQKLDIETGQIIFSGPIDNPALSVLAVRKVDDIVVGIQLAGNAKHPKTELYSDKAMSEADILSYMVSGKPISQSGAGEVVDMQSAALGLGLKQALPLLQRIGGEFGISDITVEDGSDGGSSIAAGRRITDKLYVKYVYGLLGAAGNFVVQYKLSEQLGIETTSGDSQAIDLTYRWDSKPPEADKRAPVVESTPIP